MRLSENPSRHICLHETMFTVKPATLIFGVESQKIILEKPKMYHPLRFISQWYCSTGKCCYCGVSKATARTVSFLLLQFCATQLGVTWFVNSLRNHLQPGHHTGQFSLIKLSGLCLSTLPSWWLLFPKLSKQPGWEKGWTTLLLPPQKNKSKAKQTDPKQRLLP